MALSISIEIFLSIGIGVVAGFIGCYLFKRFKSTAMLLLGSVLLLLITMLIGLALHAELFMIGRPWRLACQ